VTNDFEEEMILKLAESDARNATQRYLRAAKVVA
jgi:hypothetical protein